MKMKRRIAVSALVLAGALGLAAGATQPVHAAHVTAVAGAFPGYDHVFVIVEENKDYGRILGSSDAPALSRLATTYGYASHYFAVTHPSEPNYVALVGGSTFGIRDDDAFYCHPNDDREHCSHSRDAGYVDHTANAENLGLQLQRSGRSWREYAEGLPQPGSLEIVAGPYASKHSGFLNYASVQHDPALTQHLVGFEPLYEDLRTGHVPSLAFIIPNICNDMHGEERIGGEESCSLFHFGRLIWRGDLAAGTIVHAIQSSAVWRSHKNVAIVVTFDEDGGHGKAGCCGIDVRDPSNAGGGHVLTIVATNHGPRGVVDATPYSHYSLLRSLEAAFGLPPLAHAGDRGVVPMTPLFATPVSRSAGRRNGSAVRRAGRPRA